MIQSDPFGMVKWRFQRLSDLQRLEIFKGSPKNRQVQDQFEGVDVPYEECTVSRFAFVWAVSDIMSGWKWYSFLGGVKLIASGFTKTRLVVLVLQFCVGEVFHKFDILFRVQQTSW